MSSIYSAAICKRIGASFHHEGDKMELRIPINRKRAAIIKRILRVTGESDALLAGEAAHMAVMWIDGFIDPDEEFAANFAIEPGYGRDYGQILTMLSNFRKLGWIDSDSWKDDILEEIRQRIAENDFEPEDMEWARSVLRCIE